ncbi:hypothetical protein H0H81_002241 [Sphagnurus paluster]|uniref:CFEM domain-containing protein n=1 Tax=Sphagnurus paluster TaxID=117069 RepID=A0A9P7KGN5_9AGAR|nr:hypothetical protein H0H81_002241 [Sphagnurus paluster]
MRFSIAILAVAAAASSASAALVARQLPACATACLTGPNVDYGGCSATDNLCLCKSQTFVTKSTECIETTCTGSDLETSLQISQQLCLAVGVTLTAPTATPTGGASASSAPSSGAAPSSASASSSASTPQKTNAALANGVNAFAGLAALGLAALAL